MTILEKLSAIQSELVAPKSLYNNFWGYSYRSAETILEAIKPLLLSHKCTIVLCDELVNIWTRYYIKATATLIDLESTVLTQYAVTAFAREEEIKKGMDGSQITWASSSYARKYALNWLFLIDDGVDSDTTNTHEKNTVSDVARRAPALASLPDEQDDWMNVVSTELTSWNHKCKKCGWWTKLVTWVGKTWNPWKKAECLNKSCKDWKYTSGHFIND